MRRPPVCAVGCSKRHVHATPTSSTEQRPVSIVAGTLEAGVLGEARARQVVAHRGHQRAVADVGVGVCVYLCVLCVAVCELVCA